MVITNIERLEPKDKTDEQVAYDVVITIDNRLEITGVQILYTFADEGSPFYIKWPSNVKILNSKEQFSIEQRILDGLDTRLAMKEMYKKKASKETSKFSRMIYETLYKLFY